MMKNKYISLILAVMMMLCLAACGGGGGSSAPSDPNLGRYEGHSYEMLGFAYPIEEIYTDGESYIELKTGGKCKIVLGGDAIDGTWSLSGSDIEVITEGVASNGTLEDGVLYLDFMNAGMNMVFGKPGADLPEIVSTGLDDWDLGDDEDWDIDIEDWNDWSTEIEPYDGSIQPLDDSNIGVYLPEGFGYDPNWVAWNDGDVKIWLSDAALYETVDEMYYYLEDKEYYESDCEDYYVYLVEDPNSFYGFASYYYVDFCGELDGYEGCRIMVTSTSGDMDGTQSDGIYDMIAGITLIN